MFRMLNSKIKKIGLIVLLCCLLCMPVPIFAASTSIEDMTITVVVDHEGQAHIQEVWHMNVNKGTEVYKVMKNMDEKKVTHFQVTDDRGVQYDNIGDWNVDASFQEKTNKCGMVQKYGYYELCFGIGEYGERTYTFEYDVSNFIEQYEDAQGINYAFFSEIELPIKKARITLEYPEYEFSRENSEIYAFGYEGTVVFDNGQVVMETTESLSYKNNKMQLLMKITDGIFELSYENNETFDDILAEAKEGSTYQEGSFTGFTKSLTRWLIVYGIFVFVMFLALFSLILSTILRSRARHKGEKLYIENNEKIKPSFAIDMYRDIPCDQDIFEFYYLAKVAGVIDDKERSGLITAFLLQLLRDGKIKFEKREETSFIFFKKDGFSIEFEHNIDTSHELEKTLLTYLRRAAGSNQLLETNEFEKWCKKNYDYIDSWFRRVDYYAEYQLRTKGLLWEENCILKFLFYKFPYTKKIFSLEAKEEMEHIIGLKKFLSQMSSMYEKEVIEVQMWEDYLIFASVLGIAHKVERQLGRMCPQFSEESQIDIVYTTVLLRSFADESMRAARSARAAAERASYDSSSGGGGSSSSSGGGSSYSGGGGGGVR